MDKPLDRLRMTVRGFSAGKVQFEEYVELAGDGYEAELALIAMRHAQWTLEQPGGGMIELEFLDVEDQQQRFLRIGSTPEGMVRPVAVRLTTETIQ